MRYRTPKHPTSYKGVVLIPGRWYQGTKATFLVCGPGWFESGRPGTWVLTLSAGNGSRSVVVARQLWSALQTTQKVGDAKLLDDAPATTHKAIPCGPAVTEAYDRLWKWQAEHG